MKHKHICITALFLLFIPQSQLFASEYYFLNKTYTKLGVDGTILPSNATWADGLRMVRDNVTRIIWEVKSPTINDINYCGRVYDMETYKYNLPYFDTLNDYYYGGYNDWILPGSYQYETIYHRTIPKGLNEAYFQNECRTTYWTNESYFSGSIRTWVYSFASGEKILRWNDDGSGMRAMRYEGGTPYDYLSRQCSSGGTIYGLAPFTANFNCNLMLRGGVPPYQYQIDFGDNTITSFINLPEGGVSHTYKQRGEYTAHVVATDNTGLKIAWDLPPIAAIGDTPIINYLYASPSFSTNSPFPTDLYYKISEGEQIYEQHIDWGDGTQETLIVYNNGYYLDYDHHHSYRYDGIYEVTLTVTDENSKVVQRKTGVVVGNHPPAIKESSSYYSANTFKVDAVVNPAGKSTKCDILYGTSPNSLSNKKSLMLPDSTNYLQLTFDLSNIHQPNQYFYKIACKNDQGTSMSSMYNFSTTLGMPWLLLLLEQDD